MSKASRFKKNVNEWEEMVDDLIRNARNEKHKMSKKIYYSSKYRNKLKSLAFNVRDSLEVSWHFSEEELNEDNMERKTIVKAVSAVAKLLAFIKETEEFNYKRK